MTKYYLPNGDEIKVGEVYKTRDGRKAFISYIGINSKGKLGIVGMIVDSYLSRGWGIEGNVMVDEKTTLDLISLWKDEPVTNCNQLIEVTEEMIEIALKAYFGETSYLKYASDKQFLWTDMKDALEAVFTHIANNKEKPNSSIFDSFPPENPILDEEKQGEWIERKDNDVLFTMQKDGSIRKEMFFPWWVTHYCIASGDTDFTRTEQTDLSKIIQQVDDVTKQILEMNDMVLEITESTDSIRKILDEKDQIIEELQAEIVKLTQEPKKQTLLEYLKTYYAITYATISDENLNLVKIISEYLEQSK